LRIQKIKQLKKKIKKIIFDNFNFCGIIAYV